VTEKEKFYNICLHQVDYFSSGFLFRQEVPDGIGVVDEKLAPKKENLKHRESIGNLKKQAMLIEIGYLRLM